MFSSVETTMSPRELPPELCDHVIDYLWDDPHALIACSLTCRGWVPTTRLHLFEAVKLKGPHDCARLHQALNASGTAPTAIADCIRDLSIITPPSEFVDAGGEPAEGGSRWLCYWMPKLLPKLCHVNCLRLEHVDWELLAANESTKDCILCFSPNLKELHLSSLMFATADALLQTITSFPQLITLEMSYLVWWGDHSPSPSHPPPPELELEQGQCKIRIEQLSMSYLYGPTVVLDWLLRPPFDLRLRRFEWDSSGKYPQRPILMELLRKAEESLEHLRLTLWDEDFLAELDLSNNVRLAHLDIGLQNAPGRRDVWYPSVPGCLSRITSPFLREIKLQFSLFRAPDFDLNFIDWARLDEILAELCKTRPLLSVTFHFHFQLQLDGLMPATHKCIADRLKEALVAGLRARVVCSGVIIGSRSTPVPDQVHNVALPQTTWA